MQRSSIIATVVAAGGILVAGSVASVAVINASSMSTPESTTVTLVSDDEPATESTGELTAETVEVPAELAPVESGALPSVPTVGSAPATGTRDDDPADDPADDPDDDAAAVTATGPTASATPKPTKSARPASTVSSDRARAIVLDQGKGVAVLGVSKATRGGLQTWAVRIERSNGEVLTGYVDRASGVVMDWVVNSGPTPAPQPTQTADDDDRDEEYEDDDSGKDDDEADEADEIDEDYDNDGEDDDD